MISSAFLFLSYADKAHITINKNAIPNDPRSPFITSGVRVGTAAVSARGMVEEDMKVIADCLWDIATDFEAKKDSVSERVANLVAKYPIYE